MIEKEIERCFVVEYRRVAASSTGVPSASPMASGRTPHASARDGVVVTTITLRAIVQMPTPRKKVRRKPDRVGQRPGEQREYSHRRRPDPADQSPGGLVVKAEILRKPQNHRLIRDRVRGVDEELDQERQPQLALRSLEDGELREKSAQPRRRDWRNILFSAYRRFSDWFAQRF